MAKSFETSYLRFQLPEDWGCKLRKLTWVCRSQNPEIKKSALFVITAKEISPETHLNSIRNYLKQKKTLSGAGGKLIPSHVYSVENVNIDGTQWIQAIHLNSELEEFYTYYFATLHENRSILFTFSFDKLRSAQFSPILNKAYKSLRLKKSQFINQVQTQITTPQVPKDFDLDSGIQQISKIQLLAPKNLLIIVGILAFLILIYAFIPVKKKKKKKKKRNKKGPLKNIVHKKRDR